VSVERRSLELRRAWEHAVGRNSYKDALAAIEALERIEPTDPAWPHRRGDVLRRLGRTTEAEEAFTAAVRLYVARGYLTRAVALAKIVVDMNPERADILGDLDQGPTQRLRAENRPPAASPLNPRLPPPPRAPSGTMGAVHTSSLPPIPREEPPVPPPPATEHPAPEADEHPSLVAGVPTDQVTVVAAAMGLEPARDSAADEVRFENVPDVFAVEVDLSELEPQSSADSAGSEADVEVRTFDAEEAPSAVRLALMSGATLFADVPEEVMTQLVRTSVLLELANGASVFRRNEDANGLYVLVEGKVRITRPGEMGFVVTEGHILGEDCLLEGATRTADAVVHGHALAMRIPKEALDAVVKRHAAVGNVLFELLVRRLVAHTLQTSPLFAAFDAATRKELARLFEVRRASPGVVIKERGKRSDGLYIPLAGEFDLDNGKHVVPLPLGSLFGHASMLSQEPEKHTIRVLKEAVVLRLPAARFLAFAARFPKALAHLTELAQRPHAL
jgi:CRP-like cAMP-binding protein